VSPAGKAAVVGYLVAVGYLLGKAGAAGRIASALMILRDDVTRRDWAVQHEMALAIEHIRAQNRADVSRETSTADLGGCEGYVSRETPSADG
jgi:hypothetical protein